MQPVVRGECLYSPSIIQIDLGKRLELEKFEVRQN